MATIEISSELTSRMVKNIWQTSKDFWNNGGILNLSSWPVYSMTPIVPFWVSDLNNNFANLFYSQIRCHFSICKGSIPNSLKSDLPLVSSRQSDILITYKNLFENTFLPHPQLDTITGLSFFDGSPIILQTRKEIAISSGIASWFRICVFSNSGMGEPTHQIVGSVGLINSGADLQMENTNIVANSQYSISNLTIQFKNKFVY